MVVRAVAHLAPVSFLLHLHESGISEQRSFSLTYHDLVRAFVVDVEERYLRRTERSRICGQYNGLTRA